MKILYAQIFIELYTVSVIYIYIYAAYIRFLFYQVAFMYSLVICECVYFERDKNSINYCYSCIPCITICLTGMTAR